MYLSEDLIHNKQGGGDASSSLLRPLRCSHKNPNSITQNAERERQVDYEYLASGRCNVSEEIKRQMEGMDADHKTIPGHHTMVDTVREKEDIKSIYPRRSGKNSDRRRWKISVTE